jgi:hypothetical protein
MNATNPDTPKKRLFDLRWMLAGLLGVYGMILLGVGLTDDATALEKAAGLPINTIIGALMIVTAVVFALWEILESRARN